MIRLPSDRTLPLLIWFLLLGVLSILSMENLPVLSQNKIERIGLNQASLQDLMTIPRVSVRVAREILEKRDRQGGFKSFDDLEAIPGVGPKTLEKLEAVLKIF